MVIKNKKKLPVTAKGNSRDINYYLNLPWTYTVQIGHDNDKNIIYIICVNELPGICTDAPTVQEAMELIKDAMIGAFKLYMKHGEEIPEPINEEQFKGNIAYRTTNTRHYLIAKEAQKRDVSLSKALDELVDKALNRR